MLDKLVGPQGRLWRTSGSDVSDIPASTLPPQASSPIVPIGISGNAVDPGVLEETRRATFDIPGSVYVRFAAELKKLESVITDPVMRIKAVVTMLGISPAEIALVLSTTHSAALESWNAAIAKAKQASHAEKIGSKEGQIQSIAAEDASIQTQILSLQEKLRTNGARTGQLRQEIASAQVDLNKREAQYNLASQAVQAELAQTVSTLKSIG